MPLGCGQAGWSGCAPIGDAAQPPDPGPEWATRWGAIAVDPFRSAWGLFDGAPSKRRASKAAVDSCKKNGGKNARSTSPTTINAVHWLLAIIALRRSERPNQNRLRGKPSDPARKRQRTAVSCILGAATPNKSADDGFCWFLNHLCSAESIRSFAGCNPFDVKRAPCAEMPWSAVW